jgi:hypothetical protein
VELQCEHGLTHWRVATHPCRVVIADNVLSVLDKDRDCGAVAVLVVFHHWFRIVRVITSEIVRGIHYGCWIICVSDSVGH